MDLIKNGQLLKKLRSEKNMTQKELADKLGIVPKTVSKWETGNGFVDVSMLSMLAEILGVSEKTLLTGNMNENSIESGNIARTKFFVCPNCGSVLQGIGNCNIVCCGKLLEPLKPQISNDEHKLIISEIESELYIQLSHDMTKEHYISFIAYVGFDRVVVVRLYPEQDCAVRIPKAYSGKIVYYCNNHGLFEYKIKK